MVSLSILTHTNCGHFMDVNSWGHQVTHSHIGSRGFKPQRHEAKAARGGDGAHDALPISSTWEVAIGGGRHVVLPVSRDGSLVS